MPKEYESHEGKQAQEDFEEGMTAIFQVPKDGAKKRKSPLKGGLKESYQRTRRSRDSGEDA
jgi:hypothetical protein